MAIQPQPEVDYICRLGVPAAEMTNHRTLEAEHALYAPIATHTYVQDICTLMSETGTSRPNVGADQTP